MVDTGKRGCKECGVGTSQSKKGQSTCTECGAGSAQYLTGQTGCRECNEGYHQVLLTLLIHFQTLAKHKLLSQDRKYLMISYCRTWTDRKLAKPVQPVVSLAKKVNQFVRNALLATINLRKVSEALFNR